MHTCARACARMHVVFVQVWAYVWCRYIIYIYGNQKLIFRSLLITPHHPPCILRQSFSRDPKASLDSCLALWPLHLHLPNTGINCHAAIPKCLEI